MDWHWNGYVQEVKPHGALLDVIAPDSDGDDARWPNGLRQRVRRLLRASLRCHLRDRGARTRSSRTRPASSTSMPACATTRAPRSARSPAACSGRWTSTATASSRRLRPVRSWSTTHTPAPSTTTIDTGRTRGRELSHHRQSRGFARVSRGSRANADRLLFGPAVSMTTGGLLDDNAAIDAVDQIEAGVKVRNISWVPGDLDVFATFFYTEAEENNVDITIVPLTFFNREYEAQGPGVPGDLRRRQFPLRWQPHLHRCGDHQGLHQSRGRWQHAAAPAEAALSLHRGVFGSGRRSRRRLQSHRTDGRISATMRTACTFPVTRMSICSPATGVSEHFRPSAERQQCVR